MKKAENNLKEKSKKLCLKGQTMIESHSLRGKGAKQGYNERKVNCSCVYSAYILKPVLSGWNL